MFSGYKLHKLQVKINHLIYMDDIKLFAENKKIIRNPNTDNEDIQSRYRDKIWYRKYSMLIIRRRKRQMTLNQGKISTVGEKKTYKYLGILETDTIKQAETKEKILKNTPEERLETKLYSRNIIKSINTWAVLLVRYSWPFLKWTREKLQQMN